MRHVLSALVKVQMSFSKGVKILEIVSSINRRVKNLCSFKFKKLGDPAKLSSPFRLKVNKAQPPPSGSTTSAYVFPNPLSHHKNFNKPPGIFPSIKEILAG